VESATSPAIVVAVVVVYLIANLVVGILPGRRVSGSATGFVAGDRSLGLLVMYFITGATIFSAFAFLGGPGRVYSRGAAAFYILAYGVLGFLPFYFTGPRAARLGRRYGFVTQAEMVARRFRLPAIAGVMAAISLIAFVPYLALQIQGAGLVVAAVTGGRVPNWLGGLVVYAVVCAYVLNSGVLGAGWTNVFQGLFMMVLAWVLGLYLPWHLYGGVGAMFRRLAEERPELLTAPGLTGSGAPWTWGQYTSSVFVSIVGFSCWPHLFMKAFTAKRERTLRQTVVLYPTFQIFLIPILLIGFSGVLFESAPATPNEILPHLLMHLDLSPVVVGLFCAGALAASMSSGDTMAHATASIVVRDGLVCALGRRLDPVAERRAIRIALVLVLIASYAVAVTYEGSIVDLLLYYAYGPVVQFAPALLATLFWRRATGRGVLAGMIVGILVYLAVLLWKSLAVGDLHPGFYALAANAAVLVLVSLAAPAVGSEAEAEYLQVARTPGREG